jgi:hypothetical protein
MASSQGILHMNHVVVSCPSFLQALKGHGPQFITLRIQTSTLSVRTKFPSGNHFQSSIPCFSKERLEVNVDFVGLVSTLKSLDNQLINLVFTPSPAGGATVTIQAMRNTNEGLQQVIVPMQTLGNITYI